MERLTYRDNTVWAHAEKDCRVFEDVDEYGNKCYSGSVIDKLAEYKDTQQTQQDIRELIYDYRRVCKENEALKEENEKLLKDIKVQFYNITELEEQLENQKKDCNYWEYEAKKWCNKLGEIRMFVNKQN